jgi:hypothetical protein
MMRIFDNHPTLRPDAHGPCFAQGTGRCVVGKWFVSGRAKE